MRNSLIDDCDHLYVYNLRGNQRTSGEQSRKEGGKIFDAGSRATVAIMLAVKDSAHQGDCVLHYRDIGDYLSHEEKLEIVESADIDTLVNGYRRFDNISDDALRSYQEVFGAQVTKDDIFASIYALLHSEQYRSTYAADLKCQLPRIPLPDTAEDFRKFVEAGEQLLELHIRYEQQPDYPLNEETAFGDVGDPDFYRVQKLRWGGKARTPDKTQIVVNDNITLTGIPDEAHEYMLGSRSALEWILDRYQVKTDKASGIVNDPNDWGLEHGNPRYIVDLIKKITYVSIETMKVVKALPKLTLKK